MIALKSEGDIRAQKPIREFGDKGVFVARIERALLDGEADIAVHSLKDVPGKSPTGLELIAFLPRVDPRDALVSRKEKTLDELAPGSRIGTSSARRVVQLRAIRPDLSFVDIRGNVDTRLEKLEQGQYDAVVLAAAGLIRLGRADVITEYLSPHMCTPAPGQGIVAVQARVGDPVGGDLRRVGDDRARLAATAERIVAREVGADCATPFGALATREGSTMLLTAVMVDREGGLRRVTASGPAADPETLALDVSRSLAGEVSA